MFTGIIENIGKIKQITQSSITATFELDGIKTGDSIAINGICLTVRAFTVSKGIVSAEFDISPETVTRTSLSGLKPGSLVNVERAVQAGGRLGGHFVSGHIDCTTGITKIEKSAGSYVFHFDIPASVSRYIAEKGSIAVDGISLTVASLSKASFSAALIPHTFENTNLKLKKKGDMVNLETDILAKYTESVLNGRKTSLTMEFLTKNGF